MKWPPGFISKAVGTPRAVRRDRMRRVLSSTVAMRGFLVFFSRSPRERKTRFTPGEGGEGFQIVRKAVEPEGAGEGGDTVKGIGAGGGPEGKKAPEGVACKDPVGGGRPQSGFYPGEDAAGEGIQKGLGFSAEIGAPLEGPWGWPWG